VKTGLLAKMDVFVEGPMGEVKGSGTPSEYKKVGGILVPHKLQVSGGPLEMSMTFDTVEFNSDAIPKDKLNLPEDVKKLQK
jgi:hypothetical protein